MTKTSAVERLLWALLACAVALALYVAWNEGVLQTGMDPDYQAPMANSRPRP